jgi:hypothetical protein
MDAVEIFPAALASSGRLNRTMANALVKVFIFHTRC